MIGLVHDHANFLLTDMKGRTDVQLVGIVETDRALIERYRKQYQLEPGLFYPTFEALVAATKVEAVATFTSTYDHLRVVEECAPRGIDVMVEKPLAVNARQARAIAAAAQKGKIEVITNYATTWFPGNAAAYQIAKRDGALGELRRVVASDGHYGPVQIHASSAFLAWLTDPVQDGGGALMDFGCYGADLITWLMDGQKPLAVFATAGNARPDLYPKVEDEATIVLTYPKMQGVIQASWNWPYSRKDLEIYGEKGAVIMTQPDQLRVRLGRDPEKASVAPASAVGTPADMIAYLVAVARRKIVPEGRASLALNLTVMEILDAARESVATGRSVPLGTRPATTAQTQTSISTISIP